MGAMTAAVRWTAIGVVVACGVATATMVLWAHPARTPTYGEGRIAVGSGQPVAEALEVYVRGGWTVCVWSELPEDEGGGRLGVVLPDGWTATVPGLLQSGMSGPDVELFDRESATTLRGMYGLSARGRMLDLEDPDDAAVAQEWIDLCGEAQAYAAVAPNGVDDDPS